MVRQAVEIRQRGRIDAFLGGQGNNCPLGSPDDRSGEVKGGDSLRSAGQDEAGQRAERFVHRIDLALEPGDLVGHHPQGPFGVGVIGYRGRDIGAEVEHLVLDAQ